MSNSEAVEEADSVSVDLKQRLEKIYQRYRRRNLERRLNEVARDMSATILQIVIAEEMLPSSEFNVPQDAIDAVERGATLLRKKQFDELDEEIDEIKEMVTEARRDIENEISIARGAQRDVLRVMQELNEDLDIIDQERLEGLSTLVHNWSWEEQIEGESFEERRASAEEYGKDMRSSYDEIRTELFNSYADGELLETVEEIIHDRRTLADLSIDELNAIKQTRLKKYIQLRFSTGSS